jgi:enediyne polyketide synthase
MSAFSARAERDIVVIAESSADGTSVAVVGLACRYPDANDPPALLDLITTGRRAFRRIPPCRVDLADYYHADTQAADATYSTRAALIEGWQFDRRAFGVSESAYRGADPAHWLALETAGRALAAAGFPGGAGLPADSAAVIIGNTLAGDGSRASALRLRWPYSRQVLAEALFAAGLSVEHGQEILHAAAARYLAPFPPVDAGTLAGALPATLSTAVGGHLGFRGGAFTVDGGGASSLIAVATACTALTCGDLDIVITGGIDISLDPLELVGMAKSGVLATGDMRIYDDKPTGFLPGEGCGILVLMRTCDARAAHLPVYAEILGWGMATAGRQGPADAASADPSVAGPGVSTASDVESQLLALRRAYRKAGVDPADVQLFEGSGTGTRAADEAELTALTTLRATASQSAALGSITANIGNTKAAAGAASLIKTVLAISNGVLPPVTGCRTPHPMLCEAGATLRLPPAPAPWPEGVRLAGVSAMGYGGLNVHLVLGGGQGPRPAAGRPKRSWRRFSRAPSAQDQPVSRQRAGRRPVGAARPGAYLVHAPDRAALTEILARISEVAPWISDGEMQDLSSQLARDAATQNQVRVAIIASRQEQLARLAAEAITVLPQLRPGVLAVRPGIFAADGADGRITLLFSGQPQRPDDAGRAVHADTCRPSVPDLSRTFAATRWIEALGVRATAAVGQGAGELAGLAWAGCISPATAQALCEVRAAVHGLPPAVVAERLTNAIGELTDAFQPPRRRLISSATGTELAGIDEIAELLVAGVTSTGRLSKALTAGAVEASLLLETGPGRHLVTIAGQLSKVPAVSLDGGPDDERHAARAVAALFAVGALSDPAPLFEHRPGRPVDIWREQIFITNPCQAIPPSVQASDQGRTFGQADANLLSGISQNNADEQNSEDRRAADHGLAVAGVGPWWTCLGRQLREPTGPVPVGDDRPWRLYTGGCEPLRPIVFAHFRHDRAADRTLAVLGEMDDPLTIRAALQAATDAASTGQLVVVSDGRDLNGLWASLHAEHPALGVTVLSAPLTADGVLAASRVAASAPGAYREFVLAADGSASESVMIPVPLAGGRDFPLNADDVVLVSRGGGAAVLVLAQVIACSGAAVAIIGRSRSKADDDVIAALEKLRSAGARISYEVVDTDDTVAISAAIARIERRLGPVTAIGHAAGPAPRLPVSQLKAADLRRHITKQATELDHLVSAVSPGSAAATRLRLIATFGSVAWHYPIAAESTLALATAALAASGARLAASRTGCRALHVDWPAWAGEQQGERQDLAAKMERAGFATMPVAAGSRLLLRALASDGVPERIALHGRVGVPAPTVIAAQADPLPTGRFAGQVVLHYPGVELIVQARLSRQTDPYLADYRVDGMPVLPPTMAIEALAQAASALAGQPVRSASEVTMTAPVLQPTGSASSATLIRICALRAADTVTAVLRCESSGFGIDHYRAVFRCQLAAPSQLAAPGQTEASLPVQGSEPADGSELYGPICFQTGRFRRLAAVYAVNGHGATAIARGADDAPWFGPERTADQGGHQEPASGTGLVLGSPGLADATLQVIQACVPHRRLLPVGCESVTFSGTTADGPVTIRATEVTAARVSQASGQATRGRTDAISGQPGATVPRQRAADDGGQSPPRPGEAAGQPGSGPGGGIAAETTWDVEALDTAGQPLINWRRLVMRDAGPLPRTAPWPIALLPGYLARVTTALGLDPELEIRISRRGPSSLQIKIRAGGPAACGWQLAERTDTERGDTAREAAIAACLRAGAVPAGLVLGEPRDGGDGWQVRSAGQATIAATVLGVAGLPGKLAIAMMTGSPDPAATPAPRPGRKRQRQQVAGG